MPMPGWVSAIAITRFYPGKLIKIRFSAIMGADPDSILVDKRLVFQFHTRGVSLDNE
jgi:hypothetical protein